MVDLQKNIQWWWSRDGKTIEKPSMAMVPWKKKHFHPIVMKKWPSSKSRLIVWKRCASNRNWLNRSSNPPLLTNICSFGIGNTDMNWCSTHHSTFIWIDSDGLMFGGQKYLCMDHLCLNFFGKPLSTFSCYMDSNFVVVHLVGLIKASWYWFIRSSWTTAHIPLHILVHEYFIWKDISTALSDHSGQ